MDVRDELDREADYYRRTHNAPNGPEHCYRAGHVEGCVGSAGGDHELLPGWISYEDEDGHTVDVEVTGA